MLNNEAGGRFGGAGRQAERIKRRRKEEIDQLDKCRRNSGASHPAIQLHSSP